jgi:Na+/phosphate symporter
MDKEMSEKMIKLCQSLIRMLDLAYQGFRKSSEKSIQEAEEFRKEVQQHSSELTLSLIGKSSSPDKGKEWARPYLSIVSSFDRMGYNIDGILDRLKKMVRERIFFTDRAIKEVNDVFQETMGLLGNLPDLILTQNRLLAQEMKVKGKQTLKKADGYSDEHEQRLIAGVCVPKASPIYLDILVSLKGIVVHTLEIGEKIVVVSGKV